LFFRKQKNRGGKLPRMAAHSADAGHEPEHYRIDFDMMVKGSIFDRRGGKVRQYGVTVDGATRLVTSGDVVNRATYKALLVAGAIRPALGTHEENGAQSDGN